MDKIYTGVGPRKAPKHILTLKRLLGFKFASEGWLLRSGNAPGSDDNFYLGAIDWWATQTGLWTTEPKIAEIYLPWNGFEGKFHNDPTGHFINYQFLDTCSQAVQMASEIHPNWHECKKTGGLHTHARNVMQVLGSNLDSPSKFLICYAEENIPGVVKGGTATAVNIAKLHNVPVRNIFYRDVFESCLRYVGITEDRLMSLSGATGVNHESR